MYCMKGNYEFGIMRVITGLEPYDRKIGPETWYFAKRCFLTLIEKLAKHSIVLKDSVMTACIQALEQCER